MVLQDTVLVMLVKLVDRIPVPAPRSALLPLSRPVSLWRAAC
jgi:hypothetical protein